MNKKASPVGLAFPVLTKLSEIKSEGELYLTRRSESDGSVHR